MPVIMSTGMCSLDEVKATIDVLISGGLKQNDIIVLHCNTEYPTPMEDVNLKAMLQIQSQLGVRIGYSDHTLGIEAPLAAVALGAECIEKHFTLSQDMEGPDHVASLNPEQLKAMVSGIRNVEKMMNGSGIKEPSISESKNIAIARRSIHAVRDLIEGAIIQSEDLIALRPGDGISPMQWDEILGKQLIRNVGEGEKLTWEMFK
jgi:N-acetylneuraminate synthase/N,N'-diacetyllegionaminate synthase